MLQQCLYPIEVGGVYGVTPHLRGLSMKDRRLENKPLFLELLLWHVGLLP